MSRDAVFDEPVSWNSEQEETGSGDEIVLGYHTIRLGS
jgi:hypothetical protein